MEAVLSAIRSVRRYEGLVFTRTSLDAGAEPALRSRRISVVDEQ
jgi:hypothetical protein